MATFLVKISVGFLQKNWRSLLIFQKIAENHLILLQHLERFHEKKDMRVFVCVCFLCNSTNKVVLLK
jgi:hypothetical protein